MSRTAASIVSPERWQQIKHLFHQAADLDTTARAEFLDHHCQDDDDLRQRVEQLLDDDETEIPILDRHLPELLHDAFKRQAAAPENIDGAFTDLNLDLAEDPFSPQRSEKRFGPYRLLREIGRGGMAIVYAAVRDDEQYRRQVAIKLIRRGMDSEPILARFRQERQILANLDHPNIARLFDGGVTEDGLPYLVMELIDGEPIDRYCVHRSLSIEARLRLFLTVCQAVRYAHQNLVVHRDLKPSNLLVTDDGIPKLLDFGIAKLLEPTDDDPFLAATVAGQRPMTPDYASPEQVMGLPINTTSDVYNLGILLYRLLTGRGPYQLPRDANRRQIEDAIREQEPAAPSTVLIKTLLDNTSTPSILRWQRQLRGDLDNIVLKALRKDPKDRYGSAEELAEDVRRHLAGMPIRARPATLAYRAGKFISRHRVGMIAAGLIVLSLLGGIVATIWQAKITSEERLTAQRVSDFLIDLFEVTHPGEGLGAHVTARELLERGSRQITHGLEDRPEVKATLLDAMGRAFFKLGFWKEAEPLLEQALALRRDSGGTRGDLAIHLSHLGELRVAQARFAEAEELHREALSLRLAQFGEDSVEVAESEYNLATTLFHRGYPDQAETLTRQALARQQRTLNPDEQGEVASSLNNLALIIKSRGRLDEAIPLYREALDITRQAYGDNHPDVAVHLVNLAEALRQQGELQEARGFYEQALDLERDVLGDRHPALVDTINNLAGCLLDLKQKDEAEALIIEGLQLGREVLGEDAPAVARSASLNARLAFERRQYDVAAASYREALAIERRAHGNVHQEVAVLIGNLGAVLAGKKKDAEAEALYREALDIYRQLEGDRRAEIETLERIARLRMRQGDDETARALCREALDILERSPDVAPLIGAPIHRSLAISLLNVGQAEAAEEHLKQALKLFSEHLDPTHREVAITLVELGNTMLIQGRAAEAETELRAALALWQGLGDRGRKGRAIAQSSLAACLIDLQRFEEAEALLASSIDTFRSSFGAKHPRTLEALERREALTKARRQQPAR